MSIPDEGSAWAAVFDGAADSYDLAPLSFFDVHADALVRELGLRPGSRVLDVATGTGKVAARAAAAVGEDGLVVGVDVSSSMVGVARAKPTAPPIRFALMDARRLGFEEHSFDVVACAFGLTFMRPHLVDVVRGMRRVLRPGGLLAIATFENHAFSPLLETFLSALERVGVPRPRPTPPRWMLLDRRGHLAKLLRRGGLSRRRVVRAETRLVLRDPEDFWAVLNGTAWRSLLSRLPADASARVREDVAHGFEAVRAGDGVRLDTSALIGTGVRPTRPGRPIAVGRAARGAERGSG